MDTPENVHLAAYNKGNDYLQSPRQSSQNTKEGVCGYAFLAIPTRSTYMITSFLIGHLLLLQEHRNFLHLQHGTDHNYEVGSENGTKCHVPSMPR